MHIINGLTEGQVLQRLGSRGATARLSGTTSETGPVVATLRGPRGALRGWNRRKIGLAKAGKFAARLEGIPAGGPYRLELRAGQAAAHVNSFFVGDVWLLAGQSNMEGCGNHLGAAKSHPLIRSFSMRREWRLATEPLHVLAESPDACHAAKQCTPAEGELLRRRAVKGTGAGLYFAHEMLQRSGVPQGLICAAHGGTSMAQWDPAKKRGKGDSLYGSALLSLEAAGQPIAGVLWYQGESDANPNDSHLYAARMRGLVRAFRRDLRQPALPWIIVQIARVVGDDWQSNPGMSVAWNRIQDEQRLLADRIPHFETVAAIDLPLDDQIHIGAAGFPRLAARLARMADRLAYRNRREQPSPRLKAIGKIRPVANEGAFVLDVRFANVPGGLRSAGEPGGFFITDGNGKNLCLIYKTTIHGDTARLYLPAGAPPPNAWLSYGFGTMPVCSLTDARDLALPVFGPVRLSPPSAHLPFVTTWRKTGVVSGPPLAELEFPELDGLATTVKDYALTSKIGFVNEHAEWDKKSGQAYFASHLALPEPMHLEVLAGYDGPFRLWIGHQPFLDALDGINPCLADKSKKVIKLPAGRHDLHVAMDLNNGNAWGFFLRFRRLDVTPHEIARESYARPVYSV